MHHIAIKLLPELLENPLTDLRYEVPDAIVERSRGRLRESGYDYQMETYAMILFLEAEGELQAAESCVLDVIRGVRVLGNNLNSAVVGVQEPDGWRIIHPAEGGDLAGVEGW